MNIKTKTEYYLLLIDTDIVLKWEFNSKEEALATYNEKKDSEVYKDFEWELKQVETVTMSIELS